MEQLVAGALDVQHDTVAMEFASLGEGFEEQQIETALKVVSCHPYPLPLGIVGKIQPLTSVGVKKLYAAQDRENHVATNPRVPHISLVFREMWDTTNLNEGMSLGSRVRRSKAVVSHISRKTSEMWGTLRFVSGRVENAGLVAGGVDLNRDCGGGLVAADDFDAPRRQANH
jgi:hypothetical protein